MFVTACPTSALVHEPLTRPEHPKRNKSDSDTPHFGFRGCLQMWSRLSSERDGLVELLKILNLRYSRLFDWLVWRINQSTAGKGGGPKKDPIWSGSLARHH